MLIYVWKIIICDQRPAGDGVLIKKVLIKKSTFKYLYVYPNAKLNLCCDHLRGPLTH